jgi:GAF domain-containing protein
MTTDSVDPMSLWTPDGERKIPPKPAEESTGEPTGTTGPTDPTAAPELTPEQEAQAEAMAHELAEARARLLETEVATVLTNHALGIYELAAIHLTADDPNLEEAKLAIDAMAALIDGVAGRLGDGEPTLKEALHQARMAFVQRSQQTSASDDPPTGSSD